MIKVCIMQPTLLPYKGYFDLIKKSDVFVFYDNVQFVRKSFHNRNKVNINGKDVWLTVPVVNNDNELLNNVDVVDKKAVNKIIKTIELNHGLKLPEPIGDKLINISIPWIEFLCKELGIKTRLITSSSLGTTNILEICDKVECKHYITAGGTRDIPQLEEVFNRLLSNKITIEFVDSKADYSIVQYFKGGKYGLEK